MKRLPFVLILLAVLLSLAAPGWGGTYDGVTYTEVFYLSQTGTTTSGDWKNPAIGMNIYVFNAYASAWTDPANPVDAVDNKIGPNDCVVILNDLTSDPTANNTDKLQPRAGGLSGKPITIIGATGVMPTIKLAYSSSGFMLYHYSSSASPKHYVTYKDFKVEDDTQYHRFSVIKVEASSANPVGVRFENVQSRYAASWNFWVTAALGYYANVVFEHCESWYSGGAGFHISQNHAPSYGLGVDHYNCRSMYSCQVENGQGFSSYGDAPPSFTYTNGSAGGPPASGQMIYGETSGASARVSVSQAPGPYTNTGGWTGSGTGTIWFRSPSGTFTVGENIRTAAGGGGSLICIVATIPPAKNSTYSRWISCEAAYTGNPTGAVPSNEGQGFMFDGYTGNSLIYGCYAHHNWSRGFAATIGTYNDTVEYCIATDNGTNGYVFWGSNGPTLYNNVSMNDGVPLTMPGTDTPAVVAADDGAFTFRDLTDSIDTIYFKNNIAKKGASSEFTKGVIFVTGTWSYDLKNNDVYGFTANYSNCSPDGTNLSVDPLWVNAGGSYASPADFRLQSGSPCIKAGVSVGLTTDFQHNGVRNPPSIGAIEWSKIGGLISPYTINGKHYKPMP